MQHPFFADLNLSLVPDSYYIKNHAMQDDKFKYLYNIRLLSYIKIWIICNFFRVIEFPPIAYFTGRFA